jgi:predicted RNA-binding Zn-ribbon protein involved in translation (DUF1610 family)
MSQNNSGETPQPGVLPEHVRLSLKQYREHAERITCLECGYVGPMGIKTRTKPWYASWWASILLASIAAVALSALMGGLGLMTAFVVGGLVSLLSLFAGSTTYSCPNCNAELGKP